MQSQCITALHYIKICERLMQSCVTASRSLSLSLCVCVCVCVNIVKKWMYYDTALFIAFPDYCEYLYCHNVRTVM